MNENFNYICTYVCIICVVRSLYGLFVSMCTMHISLSCVYRVFGLERFPFEEWLLVDLDFSLLNISLCNDSQYTTWVPTDEVLWSVKL